MQATGPGQQLVGKVRSQALAGVPSGTLQPPQEQVASQHALAPCWQVPVKLQTTPKRGLN